MVGLASKKQILVVGNDELHLYVMSGKTVSLYEEFSSYSETLDRELTVALKAVNAPLVILFDLVEQQYRKETLPQVNFLDKAKVIQRKLQMAFPQQKMRSHVLMKQRPGETTLTALFAAISDSNLIDMIVRAIMDSAVGVVGAGLLPLEATGLITKLIQEAHKRAQTPDDTRWSVLMTYHKTGGLRQVVIRDGELALTRMTPIPVSDANSAQIADEMVREFNATLTYLSRFGYVPSDGLDLMVVSSQDVCQRMRQYGLAVTHLYPVTVSEAGQMAHLGINVIDHNSPYADVLHAAWAVQEKKLAVPLVSPILERIKMARQIAKLATIILVFASLYVAYQCAILQMDNVGKQDGVGQLRAKNQELKREVDELSATLNTLKYDPEKTSVMLSVYDEHTKQDLSLDATLNLLMAQVNRHEYHISEITIEENVQGQDVEALQQAAIQAITQQRQQEAAMKQPKLPDGSIDPDAPQIEIVPPEAKQVVTVRADLRFNEEMSVEQAARATYEFIEKLEVSFPGRDIILDEIVGNLSEDKTVEGRAEDASGDSAQSSKKDLVSKFTIRGMLE